MQFDVGSCHIRKPKDFGFPPLWRWGMGHSVDTKHSARFEATQILNIAPSLLGGVDGWWWVVTQKALSGTCYEHQYFMWSPPPLSKRQNPVTAGWPPHCPTAAELSKRTWLASASASDTNHFVSGWGNSSDMFWALNGTLKDTKVVWSKVFQRCHSITKRTSGLEWTSYGDFGCSLTIFWAICTSLRLWANSWGHNQHMDRSRLSSSSEGDAKWDIQVGSVFSMEYSPFCRLETTKRRIFLWNDMFGAWGMQVRHKSADPSRRDWEISYAGSKRCRSILIQNPKSEIQNPKKSEIQNPKSEIQNPNGAVWGRHKKNED